MSKRKLVAGLLTSASILGVCMSGVGSVDAAVVSNGSTDGSIGFTGSTINPSPNGDLDLLWYPTAFDFGSANQASTAAQTYTATNGSTKYAIVRDNRVGNSVASSPNEWKLMAQATTLVDGADTLTGASYEFTGNVLKSYVSASGMDTEVPESAGAISNTLPVGHTAAVTTNVSLPADGTTDVEIMRADDATVDGKYVAELNAISLKVPASTSKEGNQYVGSVNWTLDDTI